MVVCGAVLALGAPTHGEQPGRVLDEARQAALDSAVRAFAETGSPIEQLWGLTDSHADPNDWRVVSDRAIGIRYTPLTTGRHQRVGTRERVHDVESRHPDRLQVRLDALATRVLFAADNTAVGVEYLDGASLPRARATERRPRGAAADPGFPRGNPGRRGIQYPAAPDAVRGRTRRRPLPARHPGAGGPAGGPVTRKLSASTGSPLS